MKREVKKSDQDKNNNQTVFLRTNLRVLLPLIKTGIFPLMLSRSIGYLAGKNSWGEFPGAIEKTFYKIYHEAVRTRQNRPVETIPFTPNDRLRLLSILLQMGLSFIFMMKRNKKNVAYGTGTRKQIPRFPGAYNGWFYCPG